MKRILPMSFLLLGLLLVGLQAGCKQLGALIYIFTPEKTSRSVDAEYKGLSDATVATVVYATQATQVDYPLARLGLASVVNSELKKNLKNVQAVDPRKVMKFQDETANWEHLPRTELARRLGADFVLYIVLAEYATTEPASTNLYRGRISAEASLFKASLSEKESRVWGKQDFRCVYPPNTTVGVMAGNDEEIAYHTQRILAEEIVRKFYKHKVEE